MSDVSNEDAAVDWNAVVDLLRKGKSAEIPCANERDYARRTTQVLKRAERKHIAVEVIRGEGALRVEPRSAAGDTAMAQGTEEGMGSSEGRRESQETRGARRAERRADRSRDD